MTKYRLWKKGTDYSVPFRKIPTSRTRALVDRAVCPLFRRVAFLCLGAAVFGLNAQAPYAVGTHYGRGQDVSPTFEGWEGNPDGSFTMYFGYYNRNAEEEVDVPLGPANHFDGDPDQGQPTHFYTGRRWFVFKKVVPKTWTQNDRLTWTLTSHGRTNVSKGWLQPEWEIDKALITKNSPADPFLRITNSTPNPNNKPPGDHGELGCVNHFARQGHTHREFHR